MDSSRRKHMKKHNETWVQSLSQDNPLEEGMAAHSNVLAWGISWTEEPGRLQSIGLQRVRYGWNNLAHKDIKITFYFFKETPSPIYFVYSVLQY